MSERQKITDEELEAILTRIWGPKPWFPKQRPKPKVVTSGAEIVRDAEVKVSEADPNYPKSDEGVVRVRRSDWVTINMDLYEAQQRQKQIDRRHRREIDPYRMGHWETEND